MASSEQVHHIRGKAAGDGTPHARTQPAVTPIWALSRRSLLQMGVSAATVALLAACGQPSGQPPLAIATAAPTSGPTLVNAALTPTPAASAASGAVPTPTAIVREPNILFVTVDTLRADQLGAYGNTLVKTPVLDRLAGAGARFALHLVQQPQTNPSHASMFSGMYPASNGVRVHMIDKLATSIETMASLLKAAGWATAGLFSWYSFDPQYSNFQRGFDVYSDLSPKPQIKGSAATTTDAAIKQLQAFARERFFMWVHYFDAHYPYAPPGPFDNQYDPGYQGPVGEDQAVVDAIEQGKLKPSAADVKRLMSLYQGEISFLDGHLGRLLNALDQLDLSTRTLVAVTADHGEAFGEHADSAEGIDFFHPHSLHNTEQRVPLILRYPERIKPGQVIGVPTQGIDLLPTFLTIAGRPVPGQVQGSSLVPLLEGSDSGATRAAYCAMPDYFFTSVTVPGWKYIQNNANGARQLFDLRADPAESHDAAG
ncbi:MAG: sulfatase-like hydrolase/transferase, partial [Chloroflexi bacterium]|nr:sulfatase-like hydrolase/transferase [Chloroflexota bacterium]